MVQEEAVLRFKVDKLEEQIDTYWKQRAHVNWLMKGDRNTTFFHNACKEGKRHNRIYWQFEEGVRGLGGE